MRHMARIKLTTELKTEAQSLIQQSKDIDTPPRFWSVDPPSDYGGVTLVDATVRLAEDEIGSEEELTQQMLEDFFFYYPAD